MEPNYKTVHKQLKIIEKKVSSITNSEYVFIKDNLKKLVWYNFLMGVARGLGMAVGFTLLGALSIYILQKIVLLNLPGISRFIADIINLVQSGK